MDWWIANLVRSGEYAILASWIFWVLFSITMHELSHGWAAIRQGDRTPIDTGHMTPNPIVHMGPVSLVMFAIIGLAWGLMPVDPLRFKDGKMGRVIVAAAGPVMNLSIAAVVLALAAAWEAYGPAREPLRENMMIFLFTGGWLNVVLAALNMLPIPPLDGSQVLAGFSFRYYRLIHHPQAMMVGFFLILVVFLTPVSDLIFGAAIDASLWYRGLVAGILPEAAG